jgi:hypothetical protein
LTSKLTGLRTVSDSDNVIVFSSEFLASRNALAIKGFYSALEDERILQKRTISYSGAQFVAVAVVVVVVLFSLNLITKYLLFQLQNKSSQFVFFVADAALLFPIYLVGNNCS